MATLGRRLGVTTHAVAMPIVTVAVSLALALTVETGPAAGATGKACRRRNTDSGQTYTRLQAAVNVAQHGDKLAVRGTCAGHTAIGKRLTVVGERTRRSGGPQLSGRNKDRVLTIAKGARVMIRDLVVTQGDSKWGGGIQNNGDLILTNVKVRGNRCQLKDVALGRAGGILNRGRLWLNGASRVQRNWCDDGTAGVWNAKPGTIVLNGSSTIAFNGGVYGGGVDNAGTIIMNDRSAIAHNSAGESTGGVGNSGRFVMRDRSTIKGNGCGDPDYCGTGGVWNGPKGSFTMLDRSSIRDSEPAGVYTAGTFTMKGASTISNNTGWYCDHAGGVHVSGGRFSMTGSSRITGNKLDPEYAPCETRGAGLYHNGGTIHGVRCGPGTPANVYGNTPDDCYFAE